MDAGANFTRTDVTLLRADPPPRRPAGPMSFPGPAADPLAALRAYRILAPWGLRDLAALTGGVLEASGVIPLSAAARTRPTERTIRFYVARGLVSPPEGRGTAAMYGYQHFLQVLAIKLRQMEGATLEALTKEFAEVPGEQLERRVAGALGPQLPPPGDVAQGVNAPVRGRSARSLNGGGPRPAGPAGLHRRVVVAPGVELLIDASHPVFDAPGGEATLIAAIRAALAR